MNLRRGTGHKSEALAEFEVLEMDDKDKIASLEIKLSLERARVKELKAQLADMAERCLNLVWEKEALEAEVNRLHRAREGEE